MGKKNIRLESMESKRWSVHRIRKILKKNPTGVATSFYQHCVKGETEPFGRQVLGMINRMILPAFVRCAKTGEVPIDLPEMFRVGFKILDGKTLFSSLEEEDITNVKRIPVKVLRNVLKHYRSGTFLPLNDLQNQLGIHVLGSIINGTPLNIYHLHMPKELEDEIERNGKIADILIAHKKDKNKWADGNRPQFLFVDKLEDIGSAKPEVVNSYLHFLL